MGPRSDTANTDSWVTRTDEVTWAQGRMRRYAVTHVEINLKAFRCQAMFVGEVQTGLNKLSTA